jgi:hypothetical protein
MRKPKLNTHLHLAPNLKMNAANCPSLLLTIWIPLLIIRTICYSIKKLNTLPESIYVFHIIPTINTDYILYNINRLVFKIDTVFSLSQERNICM